MDVIDGYELELGVVLQQRRQLLVLHARVQLVVALELLNFGACPFHDQFRRIILVDLVWFGGWLCVGAKIRLSGCHISQSETN